MTAQAPNRFKSVTTHGTNKGIHVMIVNDNLRLKSTPLTQGPYKSVTQTKFKLTVVPLVLK